MAATTTFAQKNIRFLNSLRPDFKLPRGVEVLVPYASREVKPVLTAYYKKYYDNTDRRIFLFGINPGRFGSGITGISFTDPVQLKEAAGIDHPFEMRAELSAQFIYAVMKAYGGIPAFTADFFLTSVCPLGFTAAGKNYNYYDDPLLERRVRPFVVKTMNKQLAIGARRERAICIGEGDNFKYFSRLNHEHGWFDQLIALPHPRWVMQYRRSRMEAFINQYVSTLREVRTQLENL